MPGQMNVPTLSDDVAINGFTKPSAFDTVTEVSPIEGNVIEPSHDESVAAPLFTSANMAVHNDTLAPVTVKVPESQDMQNNFPSQTISQENVSSAIVRVKWFNAHQSWFDVTFNDGHKIRVDLGSGQNSTSGQPLYFPDRQVALMIWPAEVSPVASSFGLDFFVGTGIIPALVDSFLQANLPAILDYVNTNGIYKKWDSWGLSIGLTNIAMNPADLICSYSGVSKQTDTSTDFNIVVRANQTTGISGDFAYRGESYTLDASVTNLAFMTSVHVDWVAGTIEVTGFKVSIEAYSLPWELWVLIGVFNEPLALALKAATSVPNELCAIVNTGRFNSEIIDAINKALKDISFPLGPPGAGSYDSVTVGDAFKTWMSNSRIQNRTLANVHLPGSHDSGTYALTHILPNLPHSDGIKYPDIKFLWGLKTPPAPSDGNWPLPNFSEIDDEHPLHVGQTLYDFVINNVVMKTAQAGDIDILGQLEAGIRWLDLRIYHDNDSQFYMQHGVRGPLFNEILAQVRVYLNKYPSSRELIILNLSHADFNDSAATQVANMAADAFLPDNLLHFANTGQNRFDFQSLADRTIASLVGDASKVMLINQDSITYPAPVTNTNGFCVPDDKGNHHGMWNLSNTHLPTAGDIVPFVVGKFQNQPGRLLEALATVKNGELREHLRMRTIGLPI